MHDGYFEPTPDQQRFVEKAPPESVLIACPGSGKTRTAVRRFLERAQLASKSGFAFLSYTNAAIDEVQKRAREENAAGLLGYPNVACTLDAFFLRFVFRPFIGSFLDKELGLIEVMPDEGSVPSAVRDDPSLDVHGVVLYPMKAWQFSFRLLDNGDGQFKYKDHYRSSWIPITDVAIESQIVDAKKRCLLKGFVTFSDVLFWCDKILETADLNAAGIVAGRFHEIIVDEAQDTSAIQQRLLCNIAATGAQIAYVGDPDQGIYLFNHANPIFLEDLIAGGHTRYDLTENWRSNDAILEVVTRHFGRKMISKRGKADTHHGAYIVVGTAESAISRFEEHTTRRARISVQDRVIIARRAKHILATRAPVSPDTLSPALRLAVLAWNSMAAADAKKAAEYGSLLIRSLMTLSSELSADVRTLRSIAWDFLNSEFPEPGTQTPADWVLDLKAAVREFSRRVGLTLAPTFANRLTVRRLPSVGTAHDYFVPSVPTMRSETIHGVKGETIKAVLVTGPVEQHKEWLDLTDREESNICYVAFTRAADLLILHCPTEAIAEQWRKRGFIDLPADEDADDP